MRGKAPGLGSRGRDSGAPMSDKGMPGSCRGRGVVRGREDVFFEDHPAVHPEVLLFCFDDAPLTGVVNQSTPVLV